MLSVSGWIDAGAQCVNRSLPCNISRIRHTYRPMLREHSLPHQDKHLTPPYVGRFAPSPSGPLHFGSLICALASFLHAKQANGKWLVRIEDIDTPRVDNNMSPLILDTLSAHGMQWDADVVYQSQRHPLYQSILNKFNREGSLYACQCTRKQIRSRAEYYDRHCRDRNLHFENRALRWRNDAQNTQFCDCHYGLVQANDAVAKEDPVLRRADGIFTYQLAVVADDIDQKVTHIVRGADLIDTTPLQISLFDALAYVSPTYLHIPIATNVAGQKLSKQNFAPALDNDQAINNLKSALVFLGAQAHDFANIYSIGSLIDWAIVHWQPESLPLKMEIPVSQTNDVYYIEN